MSRSESIPGMGIYLSNELILRRILESRLSHEPNRFKSPRYCLSHELIQSICRKALESKAQNGYTKSTAKLNDQKVITNQQ